MKIAHSVVIKAPLARVWDTTVEVEAWPQWSPNFLSVRRLDEGPLAVGRSTLIEQRGLPPAVWIMTSFTPYEGFTWESRVRGIRMIATHDLTTELEGTRNTLRVELRGLAMILLWPLIYFSARQSLARENSALKAKCEAAELLDD